MQIRAVRIAHFRGVNDFVWFPNPGINALVGPGDVGKTTVLDAIAMVLSPAPGWVASEHDYFGGDTSTPFSVELLIGQLDDDMLMSWPVAPIWSWNPASKRVQPGPDPDLEGVLRVGVRGSSELEISHFARDPSGGELPFSVTTRRKLGLSTLESPANAYRELRMSRGSLLSRSLDDEQLRRVVVDAIQLARSTFSPSSDLKTRVDELSAELERIAPGAGALALGMLPPRGQNLLGMVGLFADRGGYQVPLASAGLGTQQLALFTLATKLAGGTSPIFVIDEMESGLEPFRQRDLIARLSDAIGDDGQAFLTTHSPAVVGELPVTSLHRITRSATSHPTAAPLSNGLERVRRVDPEALLCRLPIIAEGDTEVGLLHAVLEHLASVHGTTIGAIGIRCVDGAGQPQLFSVTDGFRTANQSIGVFLDTDTGNTGKRQQLADDVGVAFATYTSETCFERAIAKELPLAALDELLSLPEDEHAVNSRYQQLNAKSEKNGIRRVVELADDVGEADARAIFVEAALASRWFKHRSEGRRAGHYLVSKHPSTQIVQDISKLWTASLALIGSELPDYAPTHDSAQP